MKPGKRAHLLNFGAGQVTRKYATYPSPLLVHLQHYHGCLFAAHAEKLLKHDDDEIHRRVVIVQKHYFIERGRLDALPFRLESDAFTEVGLLA